MHTFREGLFRLIQAAKRGILQGLCVKVVTFGISSGCEGKIGFCIKGVSGIQGIGFKEGRGMTSSGELSWRSLSQSMVYHKRYSNYTKSIISKRATR